jgi:hypothetical protein
MWMQQNIVLSPKNKGYHLITQELLLQLQGLMQLS